MPSRVARNCECCGETFWPLLEKVRIGRGRFCSRVCVGRGPNWVPPEQRFKSKVSLAGPTISVALGPCHMFEGGRDEDGYGAFWFDGKQVKAHRVAFYFANGRWPTDCACHKCDNPPCCNPDHLFEETNGENTADRDRKGRHWAPRGEQKSQSKLSSFDVIMIREAHAKRGKSYGQLARRFKVSIGTIGSVVRRQTWKHVA